MVIGRFFKQLSQCSYTPVSNRSKGLMIGLMIELAIGAQMISLLYLPS